MYYYKRNHCTFFGGHEMQVSTNLDGQQPKHAGNPDYLSYQLLVTANIGIGEEITVVFRSASRDDTSYEIIDSAGSSMGGRRMRYAGGCLNAPLVKDLNVLLEVHGVKISDDEFQTITDRAVKICESRYGNGNSDGDVIVTIQ